MRVLLWLLAAAIALLIVAAIDPPVIITITNWLRDFIQLIWNSLVALARRR